MKSLVYIQSVLFALIGIGLLYYTFQHTNFTDVFAVLKSGNYWVMLPVFIVSILVYVFRVLRWKILFETIQINAPFKFLLASLCMGYLVNFVVPRLGEITRALVLKKTQEFPINKSISTIVFERGVDTICLILILLVAFICESIFKGSIFSHFVSGVQILSMRNFVLALLGLSLFILIYFLTKKFHNAISDWIQELFQTFLKLLKIENRIAFLFHTMGIWIGFFLMTYLWFFMFNESAKLTAYQAFQVMALGVVARSLPIQAGSAGAYHFVVSQALLLMGIGLATGNALAIIIHGFQTILTLVFGFTAYFWLFIQSKSNEKIEN